MRSNLSRRDFHKLTSAALSGMVAGTMFGCSSEKNPEKNGASAAGVGGPAGAAVAVAAGIHACRGLNDCKGQGAEKQNACAGQGTCATVGHDCAAKNDCKHQGGCGEAPGYNDCKTKGGCAVPMSAGMWEKARARFEQQMKEQGKEFGAAPAAKAG
jgi:hypothetical protein